MSGFGHYDLWLLPGNLENGQEISCMYSVICQVNDLLSKRRDSQTFLDNYLTTHYKKQNTYSHSNPSEQFLHWMKTMLVLYRQESDQFKQNYSTAYK